MSEIGLEKAAVLMLAIGQDAAAEVMKYLEPREVQKLGILMASMNSVPTDTLKLALT